MKYSIILALLILLPSSAWAQKAAQPAGTFQASPCATTGFFIPRVLCAGDLSPITIGGGDLTGSLTAPTIAKMQGTTITGVVGSGKAVLDGAADRLRSLQSFGADGTGATDSTSALQTAFNSGLPLTCDGTFRYDSLITITNVSFAMIGGDHGCRLVPNTTQSEIYATLHSTDQYHTDSFAMRHVVIAPNAAITSVTGPAKTAAVYVTYPSGTNGVKGTTVTLDDVRIVPSSTANYVLNGVYINDATNVWINGFQDTGKVTSFDANSNGIVYDGTHSPTNLHVQNSIVTLKGKGIYAPQVTANGWQGIRIDGFDGVYVESIVYLLGALDGFSDYADITRAEGAFEKNGVYVQNAGHALIHHNYVFAADMAISGGTHFASPTCFSAIWTIAIPSNEAGNNITGNTCDQVQVTGYTAGQRFGATLTGVSGTNMSSHLGSNTWTNMDYAFQTSANTAGWMLEKQTFKGLANGEWLNNSSIGANTTVPPLAITDQSNACTGCVGERLTATLAAGAGEIALTSTTPVTVVGLAVTAGSFQCTGNVTTDPAGSTTQSDFVVSLSTINNTQNSPGTANYVRLPYAVAAGLGVSATVGPAAFNVATATNLYMVLDSTFATSTNKAYGQLQCVRIM